MAKILIVDDSMSARFFLRSCIPEENYEVIEAKNGEDAIERYQEIEPDLVFMDLTMPVMDGYTAISRIKEIDPAAKIIVLTADVQKRTMDRIAQAGALHFLKKPPRKETVHEALAIAFPDGNT